MRVVGRAVPSWALWYRLANLASIAEDITFLRMLLTVQMSPLLGGSIAGGLLGSTGFLLRKKYLPMLLLAFSEREEALLWIHKIMLLGLLVGDANIRIAGGSIVEETNEGFGGILILLGLV
jgi:hypothetical protein